MKGFYGKFKGIVTDNIDPDKMLRIKAKVPAINKNEPLNWAFPCIDYLGEDCGDIKLPGKKDGVWIEFEGGDTDFPIWVGMWASKDDVPAEFLSSYNEKNRILKDKNGNIIRMTEDGIYIEVPAGKKIELGNNAMKQFINNFPNCIFSGAIHNISNTQAKV